MQSDDGKKPKKTRWMEKFRYRFDNIMARGTLAKAALLLVFSLLVIFCLALIDYLIERSVHKPMTTTFSPFSICWLIPFRTRWSPNFF